MIQAHKQAVWIYTVIVGLAIREALTPFVSHVVFPPDGAAPHGRGEMPLEVLRLLVFLAMVIRFYLGSTVYFEKIYFSVEADKYAPRKQFALDFSMGLIHFLIFFVWADTILMHGRGPAGFSAFLAILGLVLLYDLWWLLASWRYDTIPHIKPWACFNALSCLAALLIFAVLTLAHISPITAEDWSFLPVAGMTLVDFGELFSGRNVLTDWINRTFGGAPIPEREPTQS